MNRVLSLLVLAGLSSLAVRAQEGTVNGNVAPRESAGSPALECRILDSQRHVVPEVIESFNSINAYWLSFRNNTGQTPSQVTFQIAFSPDSPLILVSQIFIPGDDTGIDTPFGVPFWAMGRTRGPAKLTVIAEGLGECSYDFQVVEH